MTKTNKLGLHLSGTAEADLAQTFLDWRLQMNGEGVNSNMELIDQAYEQVEQNLTETKATLEKQIDDLTYEDVGARPNTWLPTPAEIGAMPAAVEGGESGGNLVYLNDSGSLSDTGVSVEKFQTMASGTSVKMTFDPETQTLYINTL